MPILTILSKWKYVAIIGSTVAFCYWLHSLDLERVELTNREAISKAIAAANTAAVESCQEAQLTTQRISNEYQKERSDLLKRVDAAKQLRPNSCIEVYTALTSSRRNAAALAARSPDKDATPVGGIMRDDLIDDARFNVEDWVKLGKCQDYMRVAEEAILNNKKKQVAE